ncbi:hypothetical protein [Streptomyces shenzhenensis]|uniref:hypothetical protein n=1 Tax=Streptomyces shenzhenensis TaxID=943815 RepID=UPI00215D64F6|nr:hypothetical protein [Streptomyces shenzhenensis]
MLRRKTTLVALATVTALLGAVGSAAADGAGPASGASSDPAGDTARALCVRATRVAHRIDRDLARLNGPVTRRGSVARLQKRVDDAEAAGRDTAVLDERLTYRKSLVPVLQQRSRTLTQVTGWCTAHDHGATT